MTLVERQRRRPGPSAEGPGRSHFVRRGRRGHRFTSTRDTRDTRADGYGAVVNLTEAQLRTAAQDFLSNAKQESLSESVAKSEAEKSALCREAQNTLRAALASADSAFATGALMNRITKVDAGKKVIGGWAYTAQDSLRASVLFAGAGLDRALKRLAEDALPALVGFDDVSAKKLQDFAARAISDGESVDAKRLVSLLLHKGKTPRDMLVNSWIENLAGASAQSSDRVTEFAGALGVVEPKLRSRVAQTPNRTNALEKAFQVRNEIAHELDVTNPEAETRRSLETIRKRRAVKDMRAHVVEMLDVTQLVINDVARRLNAHGFQ